MSIGSLSTTGRNDVGSINAIVASPAMATTERGDAFAARATAAAANAMVVTEGGDTLRGGLERVAYHLYANTGADDPIVYGSEIATTSGLSYTTSTLAHSGSWSFGVRAFYVISGLEEENIDCAITIVLDASGSDITNSPSSPSGLRAFAMAFGTVRVEWTFPQCSPLHSPQGFHVYVGTGGLPNYATPVASVLFATGLLGQFVANITGLIGGTTYTVGVRAFNATAEESNTNTVNVTAVTTGPSAVESLTATATS